MRIISVGVTLAVLCFWTLSCGGGAGRSNQDAPFAHIIPDQPGDDVVVARVGDIDLPRHEFRRAAGFVATWGRAWTTGEGRVGEPGNELPREEALPIAVILVIHDTLVYDKAIKEGYLVTDKEIRAHQEYMRQIYAGPDGEPFLDSIRMLGLSVEEYLDYHFENYRETMTISAFLRDGNKDSAALQVSLRRTTPIVWYDDEFEEAYNKALADPELNKLKFVEGES